MDSKKSLVKKLVDVLSDLGPVEKSSRNKHFGYNYVSEGQMMAELRGRLSSRNVFLFTSVETIAPHYGEAKEGVYVCVTTKHTFVDAESAETYTVGGAGVGWDSGDKGVYKAITGALKYALMKNFLVTDEQDPEAGDQKKEDTAGASGHKRTRRYEDETGAGDKKVQTDLAQLESYLQESEVPPGFLLALLKEKKLIDARVTTLGGIKPGILRRCLQPASKANLLKAWAAQQADDGAAAPKTNGEVRTNEGDQTREGSERRPVTDALPSDVLSDAGVDNWRKVAIHFGEKSKGKLLGSLTRKSLVWWIENWTPKVYKGTWDDEDLLLDAALCAAASEIRGEP
jgi:ERF superfamily